MNNHKSLKAEIDAREENFSICLSLGRTLLNRRHPREEEIRDKCIQVLLFLNVFNFIYRCLNEYFYYFLYGYFVLVS